VFLNWVVIIKFPKNKYNIIVFTIVAVLYAFWVIINGDSINVVLLIIAAIALMYCLKTVVINESGVTSTWLNIFNNTLPWDTIDNIHIEQTYGRLEIPLICVIPTKNTNKRKIKMTYSKRAWNEILKWTDSDEWSQTLTQNRR